MREIDKKYSIKNKTQMKTTTILMTLLIAFALVSSAAVTASTTRDKIIVDNGGDVAPLSTDSLDLFGGHSSEPTLTHAVEEIRTYESQFRGGVVVFDNDMSGVFTLHASQADTYINLDPRSADDFSFLTADGSDICIHDVHWIGGYWNMYGYPGEFDWAVEFYEDDGTGNAPGDLYAGPFIETWANLGKIDMGAPTYYELSMDIPETCFPGCGEKFWIVIYGVGDFPPQSGVGAHLAYQNNPHVFKSNYFGIPDWVDFETLVGYYSDLAFQLTQKPDHDVGVIDIKQPYDGQELCECIPVEVTVENFGAFDETNVPVHVVMTDMIWQDGFEVWPGAWNNGCAGCTWLPFTPVETAYPFVATARPPGLLMAEFDQTPGSSTSCLMWTWHQNIDLHATCDPKISFWMWHDNFGSEDYLQVQIQDNAVPGVWTTISQNFSRIDCPGCPSGWVEHIVDIPDAYKEKFVEIGFLGFCGPNGAAYNLHIDDVSVYDLAYEDTVLVDIGVGEQKDVFLDDWCPCQWQSCYELIPINLDIVACTEMVGDQIPANDCWMETATIMLPCKHDVGAISIDEPVGDPVPCMEFDMCATIKNFGQYEECCFTTYMEVYWPQVSTDFAPPIWSEDFEHGGAWPPGWTEHQYAGPGHWEINSYTNDTSGYDPCGSPEYFIQVDDDAYYPYTPDYQHNVGLFTPSINFGYCAKEVALIFEQEFHGWGGQFYVRTYSGGTGPANFEELIWSQTSTDYGCWTNVLLFEPYTYGDPNDVYIEFQYDDNGYWAGWIKIDDVRLDVTQTFTPFLAGGPIWSDEICIESIDVCEEIPLCFESWTPPATTINCDYEWFVIQARTALCDPPDCNHLNDAVFDCIRVEYYHDVGIEITSPAKSKGPWYAYNAYGFGIVAEGPFTFPALMPDPVTLLGPETTDFMAGGCWVAEFAKPGTWYGIEYGTGALYTISQVDGAMTLIGGAATDITGIAYDEATQTAYACSVYDLYEINLADGTYTHIGTFDESPFMIGIAILDGVCYGHDIGNDQMVTIDLTDADVTVIGPTGLSCNYGQDMAADKDNGKLYLSAFNVATYYGELHEVDIDGSQTGNPGEAIYIDDFEGGLEPTGFAIPYTARIPQPDVWVQCGEHNLCVDVKNQGTFDEIDDPVTPCECEGVVVYGQLYKLLFDDPCVDPEFELVFEGEQCVDLLCDQVAEVCFGPFNFVESGIYWFNVSAVIDPDHAVPYDCFPDDNHAFVVFGVDCCDPESSHILSPTDPDGNNNWYTQDVTVKITATDPLCPDPCLGTNSGIKEIHYVVNGDEKVKTGSSVTFKVTEQGVNFVEYWSVDNAGNVEEKFTFEVAIDSVAPTVDLAYETFQEGEQWKVTLRANPGDATSSLEKVEFYVGANKLDTLTTPPWEITENWQSGWGGQTFKATAYDNAGNSASDTVVITVSKDAHTTTTSLPVSVNKVLILQR
jgi:hypothetical protein